MIKNIVVVASGKGGVGKSTISVNLATSLSKKNYNIGLLDADIYGPSIPKMLGIQGKPTVSKSKKILPYVSFGLKSMSIGNMIPQDGSVIWRGAMASNAIRQLINDVEWGDLDFLFIDLPPGTGDIALTLFSTSLNKTSPTSFVFSSFILTLFIPTSMMIAPFLTQSLFTNSGFPIAAIRISAFLQILSISTVLECTVVTVQDSFNNNWAIGFPTILDLPITTEFLPANSIPSSFRSSRQP